MTSSDLWDADPARRCDDESSQMFCPEILGPTVDLLAGLAGDGPALELAVGTGRVAVPLWKRGVRSPGSSCPGRSSTSCAPRWQRRSYRSRSATWRPRVRTAPSRSSISSSTASGSS